MIAIVCFIAGALVIMATIAILNTLTFPRLTPLTDESSLEFLPKVSVLIPARNEASVIGGTIKSLLKQDYPSFELIVVDDGSSDGTGEIALKAGGNDRRLVVFGGKPLPTGWGGKNWACHQLALEASGEILVFTDADVCWKVQALTALVRQFNRYKADVLTVWPTQMTQSWSERLVVPMMMFSIMAYLPEICVRYVPWPVFAAANGQCLAFRRKAYELTGGHSAVRTNVVEDVGLAKLAKSRGFRLVMFLGEELISTRMYHDWRQVRYGFAKNILAGHGGKPVALMLSTVFHWIVFLLPWVWLIAAQEITGWPTLPLILVILGICIRACSAAVTRQRLSDALFLPLSVLLMTVIAWQSLWWHYRHGGPQWKGRRLVTQSASPEKASRV